ncbi:response regulator [Lysobacter soli]|uniref:response regulator n=1 Tax=Lysobacter soli TaxID=453783 RepID=UPI0020A0164D|nr:response regulator [Lysobacter soli]UTA54335.1 response regulator [Lysobacter soli]
MAVEQVVKSLDAITRFLSVIAWPFVVLFVVIRFREGIKGFFDSLSEFSFKGAGLEASAKKRIEVAATLAAADVSDSRSDASPEQAAESAAAVAGSLTSRAVRKAHKTSILWVDDEPQGNASEVETLESLGMSVTTATSTEQALDILSRERFDLVVSDMGRPPDQRAGYTLLAEMRNRKIRLPFLIYAAGGNLPKNREEAIARGAYGSTNRATELFQMILRVIGER